MTAARESRALAPAPRVLSQGWESERWSLPLQPCAAALRCCAMDPHEPDSQLPLCQTWPYRNSRVFLLCACVGAGTTRHRVEHSEKNLKTENKINVRSSTACLCQADEKRSSISLLSSLFFVKGIHKVVLGKLLGDSFGPRMMGLMSFPRREETLFCGRGRHCSDMASCGCNVCSSRSKRRFVSQTTFISDKLCD